MKIAIIGSREYPDLREVRLFVHALPFDTIVISGGAAGVDSAAESTARVCRLTRFIFEPVVATPGRTAYVAALHARNKRIAEECERMVAFHDGVSKGTMRTVEYARSLGRDVEVRTPGPKKDWGP